MRTPRRFQRSANRWCRRNEKGYILVTAALVMVPLLVVAGMAVDFGGWYREGSRMQRAADAAALAAVVWLPNMTTATTVAKSVAKQNGFDDSLSNITVTVNQLATTRISVSITDNAGPVYLAKFVKNSVTITRTGVAEYNLPVPLGSPKNYFGTGSMISRKERENFYAAINGYCQDKAQGGPFEVKYMSGCSGTANGQYVGSSGEQYQYYLDLPAGRALPVVVHIWSPASAAVDAADPGRVSSTDNATATFDIRSPDTTPLNDSDNPLYTCTGSGETNPRQYTAVDNDATLLGTSGWSRFCTIPANAPAGKYIIGLYNKPSEASSSYGINAYALMASYSGLGVTCDARTDTTCPALYGKNWISIFASSSSTSANFYLANIGPLNAGKTLEITLFDPGEGGSTIRILQPDGTFASFKYQSMGNDDATPGTLSSSTTSLNVAGGVYNGLFVKLLIDLPLNYASLYTQYWWKVQYNFSSGSVTDRTTWGVEVIGDPVHLVQ